MTKRERVLAGQKWILPNLSNYEFSHELKYAHVYMLYRRIYWFYNYESVLRGN